MLPTFVIGLREGLEAALIVGIIAAFLRKQGRRDLLRWVFVGVGIAIGLCVAVGVVLEIVSRDLPQQQQEGLETVIGILAIGMVTYMVVWMRQHSRELKGQLEGMAADALSKSASGGGAARGLAALGPAGRAMIAMAFLAVLREGFETVVFLLAAFNEASNSTAAGGGAALGIVVAIALGYGIYRGGVRINLSKFFRATGLVLVLVAAGLVVSALHTAHEAGWLDLGQSRTVDLTSVPVIGWLVQGGSVQASLVTGMLGIQPYPVLIEVVGWLVYLVPVACYVVWPPGRSVPRRLLGRTLLASGAVALIATVVLVLVAPAAPGSRPVSRSGAVTAQVISTSGAATTMRTQRQSPAATDASARVGAITELRLPAAGGEQHLGLDTDVYRAQVPGSGVTGRPATWTPEQIAARNGGRLPLGLVQPGGAVPDRFPVRYADALTLTAWVQGRTGRVVDLRWSETVRVSVVSARGTYPLDGTVSAATSGFARADAASAADAARSAVRDLDRRDTVHALAWLLGLLGAVAVLAGVGFSVDLRRRRPVEEPVTDPQPSLVKS